jgi:oxalate decarboxylase/phosphoglucose isomerase-like protein (cupin superfamily)
MHDETFLVIKGTGTFYTRSEKVVAAVGDYVIVPPHAPHTFGNESPDEELIIYNTFTPAYYVNYFRLMARMIKESGAAGITPEIGKQAMAQYATIQTKN